MKQEKNYTLLLKMFNPQTNGVKIITKQFSERDEIISHLQRKIKSDDYLNHCILNNNAPWAPNVGYYFQLDEEGL